MVERCFTSWQGRSVSGGVPLRASQFPRLCSCPGLRLPGYGPALRLGVVTLMGGSVAGIYNWLPGAGRLGLVILRG